MAYNRIEPFGELRADLRSGIVAAVTANTARDSRRRRKPFRPVDFMPYVDKPKQTWQNMRTMFRAFFGKK